jgi:hypothetical protein
MDIWMRLPCQKGGAKGEQSGLNFPMTQVKPRYFLGIGGVFSDAWLVVDQARFGSN